MNDFRKRPAPGSGGVRDSGIQRPGQVMKKTFADAVTSADSGYRVYAKSSFVVDMNRRTGSRFLHGGSFLTVGTKMGIKRGRETEKRKGKKKKRGCRTRA